MPVRSAARQVVALARWFAIAALVGVLAGTASAGFLAALDAVTGWRESHRWIIALLPLGGLAIGLGYHRYGAAVEGGNNLVLDEIHEPRRVIPLRMTPMILLGTLATHLFGGSAGREGTAVQMGASLADRLTPLLRIDRVDRRTLLMAGMSGGFAAVFGTPLAGMVFGLEVLALGALRHGAIFPCLVAAVVGDRVCLAWGIHHTAYPAFDRAPLADLVPALGVRTFAAALVAGAAFGLAAWVFAAATRAVHALAARRIAWPPLRLAVGGAVVALAVLALGTTRHIGLGIPTILAAFAGDVAAWDWAAKLALTAVTLGCGFKGGEVTPLFFVGATLGAALAHVLPLPAAVLAGMGFAAVFAGAANTPIACTLLAIELFGARLGGYAAIACVMAYLCSGHAGIYRSQRIAEPKRRGAVVDDERAIGHR